jgi:hypothetical protein
LAAIGRTAGFSLCGELGSAFWVAEWGYPDIASTSLTVRRLATT